MKTLQIILLSILLLIPAYAAECPRGVKELKLGDLAPCPGYFMSKPLEKAIRNNHNRTKQERDKYKKALELSDLQITKLQHRAVLWEVEAKRQSKALQQTKSDLKYGLILGFGLALVTVVVTGYALKAAK